MRFITSIFMLLTATSGVISAYFVGHGLVSEHSWPWLTAGVLIVLSFLFGFVYLRLAKGDPQPVGHEHGHADTHAGHVHEGHTHDHEPFKHDGHGHS